MEREGVILSTSLVQLHILVGYMAMIQKSGSALIGSKRERSQWRAGPFSKLSNDLVQPFGVGDISIREI